MSTEIRGVLIFAGSYRIARDRARELGLRPNQVVIVNDERNVRGRSGPEWRYLTAYGYHRYWHLVDLAEHQGLTPITKDELAELTKRNEETQ